MKALTGIAAAAALLLLAPIGLVGLAVAADESDDPGLPGGAGGGLKGVPAAFHPWILKASKECEHRELSPALLAAQLNQESGFRINLVSPAHAEGPAQFIPGTWATWGRDSDGNGRVSPYDIGDAVMAQGRLMCSLVGQAKRSGYNDDPRRLALAGYNAGWARVQQFKGVPPIWWAPIDPSDPNSPGQTYHYVKVIMDALPRFEGPTGLDVSGSGIGPDALRRASGYLGTPYSWGGGGPGGPSYGFCDGVNGYLNGECMASKTKGFDCSSLVMYAYWPDKHLPRTAAPQFYATSHRPVARGNLKPGDLVFWSNHSGIYHVAIYAGDGKILHAPRTGRNIQLQDINTAMPPSDYHGATRP
ncbi:bifunctional lytic transglycosylase/C40 family peptidase [Streptomyces sp. NPDC048629]|uniref:C40 family peptidase n=1 Tax=Streptomyces sp. NPDC048629 TaxID=3154824 RepID=UPI0034132B85